MGRPAKFAPLEWDTQLHSGVLKPEKPSPTESPLLFQIDPEPAPESLTALGSMQLSYKRFARWGYRRVPHAFVSW